MKSCPTIPNTLVCRNIPNNRRNPEGLCKLIVYEENVSEFVFLQFVDMLAGMVAVVESPPRLHEKLEDLGPMHIRKGVQASYMPQVSPAHLYRRAFQCRQSLSCRTCAAIFFLF